MLTQDQTGQEALTILSSIEQITAFDEAYKRLVAVAEQYSEPLQQQTGVCGTWSAHDVVAHLNGWLVEAQRRFPRFARGTGNINYNADAFNQVSIWLRANRDFDELLTETRQLKQALREMAESIPDGHFARDHRYGEWLEALTREAIVHTEQMTTFLRAHA